MTNGNVTRRQFLGTTALAAVAVPALASQAKSVDSSDSPQTVFPLIDLSGSPRERGHQHGELLREKINVVHEGWRKALQVPTGWSAGQYIERFLAETSFLDGIRKWTPDLEQEIQGIARGARLPFRDVYAMQMLDEEWWFGEGLRRKLTPRTKCTVVGASRTTQHPSFIAQNMDIPTYANPHLVVLKIRDPKSSFEQLILTLSGLISLNGMNNRRIALCVNALLQLRPLSKGLPIAFANRGVIAREKLEDAARFVRQVRMASGQAYNIGGPNKVMSYECSATGAKEMPLRKSCLTHTNHPLVSNDLGWYGKKWKREEAGPEGNSETRYRCAFDRITTEKPSVELLRDILGAHNKDVHPVCRHLSAKIPYYTAASTVYELSEDPKLHLTGNPPCTAPVQTFEF